MREVTDAKSRAMLMFDIVESITGTRAQITLDSGAIQELMIYVNGLLRSIWDTQESTEKAVEMLRQVKGKGMMEKTS